MTAVVRGSILPDRIAFRQKLHTEDSGRFTPSHSMPREADQTNPRQTPPVRPNEPNRPRSPSTRRTQPDSSVAGQTNPAASASRRRDRTNPRPAPPEPGSCRLPERTQEPRADRGGTNPRPPPGAPAERTQRLRSSRSNEPESAEGRPARRSHPPAARSPRRLPDPEMRVHLPSRALDGTNPPGRMCGTSSQSPPDPVAAVFASRRRTRCRDLPVIFSSVRVD